MVVSLTNNKIPPFLSRNPKDRSRMDRKPRDLCGMAVMGDIFSWLGGLSLMESHSTIQDWPELTFSMASVAK